MFDNPCQPPHRVNVYFEQLRGEIITILDNDTGSRETIHRLETELEVYKRAYADLGIERKRFEKLNRDAEKHAEELENQLKGHRIVALVDGDGAIFEPQLVGQGQQGGHTAAEKLSESILQHLLSTAGVKQYQLWVYVFLNKRGLAEAFGRTGHMAAKAKFEDFIAGFNQAAGKFIMVDAGSVKEAADAKIKAILEDEIRLPQTERIIFGGCHDNGYVTTIRSQITAGFKHKLVLLQGYSDMATGIKELDLPSFSIPELFMPEKLVVPHFPQFKSPHPALLPPPTFPVQLPPALVDETMGPLFVPGPIHEGFDALPFASAEPEVLAPKPKSPASYSSAVQTGVPKRGLTPELDSSGSTSSSDGSDDLNYRASPTNFKSRRVNPNIPLSKHKPPPCTLFYLSTCKHGPECKYGHDYILEAEHFSEIRVNAKKSPCPTRNKGEVCNWGDDCCYGHHCPLTTKCHFFKQNRCKFVGADMHKEPKTQSADKP